MARSIWLVGLGIPTREAPYGFKMAFLAIEDKFIPCPIGT